MNAEEVKVGCFQIVIVLLLGINYVIVAMSHALPAFHDYTPKFYCQTENNTNRTYGCQETSNFYEDSNSTYDSLELKDSCFGDYRFVTETDESSVVTEFGLICEKQYLKFLSPIVYYIGVLIGACIAGVLADRIGRLPVKAICLYTQGSMAVALYVVQNYPSFLALRALQGVFVQGLQNSTYILSLELFPAQARTFVALVMQVSWAIGLILLAALSYAIPDWRILQLAISVPTAVTVLYIWIIPESPRWLLAKGKSTEADIALERIAKYNGCCTRSFSARNSGESDAKANENVTPAKPERKSRVSNADVKRMTKGDDAREEAINLLSSADSPQQKSRKSSMKVIAENRDGNDKNLDTEREPSPTESGEAAKRDVPSGSRSHRKSKSTSQSIYNQRLSMKNAYEILEMKTHESDEKPSECEQNCKQIEGKSSGEAKRDTKIFASLLMRRYGAVMTFQWLTTSMAWCAFMALVPTLPVNRHITFALGGFLEIATYTFLYLMLSRYGRRLPLSVYQSLNGVICILVAAMEIFSGPAVWSGLSRTLILLLGRVLVISTISVEYLYTVEIFPTVARGTCLGLCAVFAKIGSLCTPHVFLSGKYVPVSVPLIIIGMLCLTSGGLALLLPETLNKILPDTVEDTELLTVETRRKKDEDNVNNERPDVNDDTTERELLRVKLFSEDWVDAGNGILVNFPESRE